MTYARPGIYIFIIFFCFNLFGCSDSNQKKEKHYAKALEYIKNDDEKAAILELRNAIQIDPMFADARYQLGLLYLKTGNPKGAFGELQRTASLDPENLDAGVKVAEFHLLSQQMDESRKYVEQVLSVNPDYHDGLALLANMELIEGNFTKAQEAIDKALTQAPENDKFYNIKGRILIALNRLDESEKFFQKAIELNPDNFANYRTMLMLHEQRKDEVAIQNLLDTMLIRFPDNPQLQLILADIYQNKGKLDEAEKALLKIVEIDQRSIPFRLMLVEFYKKYNLFEKAEKFLKSSLAEFPEDVQLQVALAELSFDLQKIDQARTIMENVLATNPGNGGANLIKARFLIRDGKNHEAISVITPLMNDYPKWAEPFYYSALTQLRLDNIELAQKSIEQALQNNKNNDRYHALAAQIHLTKGNSSDAAKEATIALRINRQNSIAVIILAKSFVQAKEYDKAIEFIGKLNKEAVAADAELLGSLALAYLGKDDKEKAKQIFSELIKLDPDNSKALAFLTALTVGQDIPAGISFVKSKIAENETAGHYILLGDLLAENKQFEEALQAYRKVQELAPDIPQGYILSARLLSHLGKIDETIAEYEEFLKTDPDSIAGIMGLATAFEIKGNREEAKKNYTRALKIQPNLPAAANNLAWLLASEEGSDLGEALRLAMQAKQALPDQPHIADTLGWVHYKRKSYSLAISQFRQALENRPNDPVIQYHLALALYGNGEKQQAIESLEKALDGKTNFEDRGEAENLLKEWKKEVTG
jgi:tetratricopeptide (TPR) repeat protein